MSDLAEVAEDVAEEAEAGADDPAEPLSKNARKRLLKAGRPVGTHRTQSVDTPSGGLGPAL